jgi:hypothetical protein
MRGHLTTLPDQKQSFLVTTILAFTALFATLCCIKMAAEDVPSGFLPGNISVIGGGGTNGVGFPAVQAALSIPEAIAVTATEMCLSARAIQGTILFLSLRRARGPCRRCSPQC